MRLIHQTSDVFSLRLPEERRLSFGHALSRLRPRRRSWRAGDRHGTFIFADLAGYTALTEQRGDAAAAEVAREFQHVMRGLSREHGAWHVKSMGDGVMIWSPDAAQAVALIVRALDELSRRPDMPPVRVGAHTGSAVMRGRDWYGSTVNVAARLADEAGPNEALISSSTHHAAGRELSPCLGPRYELALRGVEHPAVGWRLT